MGRDILSKLAGIAAAVAAIAAAAAICMVAVAFAVYAVGFLAAILTLGTLSDHIGRRPVLIGSLIIALAANVLFLLAPDIGWVMMRLAPVK